MAKMFLETGYIQSWTPGRLVSDTLRSYSQLVLNREDGTRVEINDFLVEDNVFSRFSNNKLCTIVILKKRVFASANDTSQVYNNQIVGYADEDGMALPKHMPDTSSRNMWIAYAFAVAIAIWCFMAGAGSRESLLLAIGITSWIILIPWGFRLIITSSVLRTGQKIRAMLRSKGYGNSKAVSY
jgi:hypothetical protein